MTFKRVNGFPTHLLAVTLAAWAFLFLSATPVS